MLGLGSTPKTQMISLKLFSQNGKVQTRLEDLSEERLRQMNDSGVDVQVLSLTTPATQNLAATDAVGLAREANDLVAATLRRYPDRFQGFAKLPTPGPVQAASELQRAVNDLGFKGAMLCGRTHERNLDHPVFTPIFEAAAELRVPLYIHPQIPQRSVRDAYYSGFDDRIDLILATGGIGWHFETGVQFIRLILAGVFDRHPDLQIILGHWGEVVLFYLERLKLLAQARPQSDRAPAMLKIISISLPAAYSAILICDARSRLLASSEFSFQRTTLSSLRVREVRVPFSKRQSLNLMKKN